MSQGKSLFKNTLIYAIGNFGSKILAFLLLPLYSFYLNKHDFGLYDLFIATVALLVPFITVQISDAVYRWLLDVTEEEQQAKVISSGLSVVITFSIIFYILYYCLSFFFKQYYNNYFGWLLLTSSFLPFFQQIARGLKKNRIYAIAGVLNTFLILVSNIYFLVFLKLGLTSLFIASIVSNILTMLFIIISLKIYRFISIGKIFISEIKEMLAYSWPLIPNSISWWLINVADKYLILYILTIESNGIYAVSSRFPAIISLFNSIFLMAWQDHGITANDGAESKTFFSETFDKFITFELTLVILLISVSQYIVKHFINVTFYESYKYMPLLYIGVAYSAFAAYIGVGYQRTKATKDIFKTTIIGGVINIAISFFLLKHIGLYAPALGTFVSFLIIYLIRKKQTNKFFVIDVNNKKIIILTCIALVYPVQYLLNNVVYSLSFILVAVCMFVYLNFRLFVDLLSMIKKKTGIEIT